MWWSRCLRMDEGERRNRQHPQTGKAAHRDPRMADLFDSTPKGADTDMTPDTEAEGSSFEEALKALEGAVEKLEAGNLPLSEALKLFEEGLRASNLCRTRLEEAKQRVDVLVARNGGDFRLRELDLSDEE